MYLLVYHLNIHFVKLFVQGKHTLYWNDNVNEECDGILSVFSAKRGLNVYVVKYVVK